MYNILLGGSAGDGIETMSSLLEKLIKNGGYHVFTFHDVMSRVRGGHNFSQLRFGNKQVDSHHKSLDGMFITNKESYDFHVQDLKDDGFILCDETLGIDDPRVLAFPLALDAKAIGNPKTITSIAIGALLSLFGIPAKEIEDLLAKRLKPALVVMNIAAINKGITLTKQHYDYEPVDVSNHLLLTGTNALTLGALAGGLNFYSAYPMSPSTEILEMLTKYKYDFPIVVEQAEDEIAAVNMAIGASYAGAVAMTGTSGGGFCLMVEAIGFAGIAEIPVVLADIQRPGPSTGLPTRTEQSDLKFVINASHGEFPRMVIALRNHEDAFYQTARAFALAKKYQMPVILLSDQYLGDSTATTPSYKLEKIYKYNVSATASEKRYAYTQDGLSPLLVPGSCAHAVRVDSDEHDEYGTITEASDVRIKMMDKRMNKLNLLKEELLEPEFIGDEQCEILFVSFGSIYGPLKEAITLLNKEGNKYGALVFGDVFPLPIKSLKKYAQIAKRIINVEQNATGQLADLICEQTAIVCDNHILKYDGRQIDAQEIIASLKEIEGGKEYE